MAQRAARSSARPASSCAKPVRLVICAARDCVASAGYLAAPGEPSMMSACMATLRISASHSLSLGDACCKTGGVGLGMHGWARSELCVCGDGSCAAASSACAAARRRACSLSETFRRAFASWLLLEMAPAGVRRIAASAPLAISAELVPESVWIALARSRRMRLFSSPMRVFSSSKARLVNQSSMLRASFDCSCFSRSVLALSGSSSSVPVLVPVLVELAGC